METERIRYIYCITNLVNGKTYFGQHTLTEGRTFETDTYRGSGKLLWRAYEKYGKENFKRTCIIKGHFSKEQINRFERCIIRIQRFLGKAEYNLADGGDGGDTSRFIDYDSETFHQHVSEGVKKTYANGRKALGWTFHNGMKGKHFSDEAKQKMHESHLGEKNSQYGKHRSEKTKKRIRAALVRDYKVEYSEMYEAFLDHVLSSDEKRSFAKKYNIAYDSINRVLRRFI